MPTVFVGNNDRALADAAVAHDSSAYLIDQLNFKDQHTGTIYVSLADLSSIADFNTVLRPADVIVYIPSNNWSNIDMKLWTERSVVAFSFDKSKTVINVPTTLLFNSKKMLELVDKRKTNDKQIWVVGCSTTYGMGVTADETYARIISKTLQLDLSLLAFPGSSIYWAADQILRSDIRAGDIVIWGLTSVERFPYYCPDEDKLLHIIPGYYATYPKFKNIVDIKHLDDMTAKYKALTAVYQIVNYCEKIGAKLVIAGIHTGIDFSANLKDLSCYIQLAHVYGSDLADMYIDLGDDSAHPGPQMH
jgi:hypothetical protein